MRGLAAGWRRLNVRDGRSTGHASPAGRSQPLGGRVGRAGWRRAAKRSAAERDRPCLRCASHSRLAWAGWAVFTVNRAWMPPRTRRSAQTCLCRDDAHLNRFPRFFWLSPEAPVPATHSQMREARGRSWAAFERCENHFLTTYCKTYGVAVARCATEGRAWRRCLARAGARAILAAGC